jgi:hypothetical protein
VHEPQLPPPANRAVLPVLAAVTYLACVIAAWGILSLLLDRDVIDYADAGPLLGPAIALAAGVITWIVTWRSRTVLAPVIALFSSYLAMIVVGAVGYTLTSGLIARMPEVAAHFAISPFVAAAALLSPLVVLAARALAPR